MIWRSRSLYTAGLSVTIIESIQRPSEDNHSQCINAFKTFLRWRTHACNGLLLTIFVERINSNAWSCKQILYDEQVLRRILKISMGSRPIAPRFYHHSHSELCAAWNFTGIEEANQLCTNQTPWVLVQWPAPEPETIRSPTNSIISPMFHSQTYYFRRTNVIRSSELFAVHDVTREV